MKAKLQLIALFAMFFIPVLVAFVLNTNPDIWKPSATINHGELIQPPIHIGSFDVVLDDGTSIDSSEFQSHWTLLGVCNDDISCQNIADKLSRLRVMTGRHANRIKTLIMHSSSITLSNTSHAYTIGKVPAELEAALLGQDPGTSWIIDPRGYLMMRYKTDFLPADLKKDMDRLLKYNEQDKVSFDNE